MRQFVQVTGRPAPVGFERMADVTDRKRSLVDGAEEALRNWLAPGRHRSGDRLPPEHELASMLGVSRGTLRTALERLEATGEIVRRQGSGTFVGHVARPGGFREGLERLESYSSLARRRGVELGARDVVIEHVPLDELIAQHLGEEPGTPVTRISRVVLADGEPFALMVDTLHPGVPTPSEARLRRAMERGDMVLDVLLGEGVPVAYSSTTIEARLLSARQPEAKALGVRRATAVLDLEEVYHATSGDVTHHSRDLFAPDGLDLRVVRWLEARRPAPLNGRQSKRGAA
jgi:DNA-binding GntR family transcriptional regulator